jgi:hypothetical protein
MLSAVIRRSGPRSLYGDLEVVYTPAGGRPVTVGSLRGVGVYPEIDQRTVSVTLSPPQGATLGPGAYSIVFRDDETPGGAVLARAQVQGS